MMTIGKFAVRRVSSRIQKTLGGRLRRPEALLAHAHVRRVLLSASLSVALCDTRVSHAFLSVLVSRFVSAFLSRLLCSTLSFIRPAAAIMELFLLPITHHENSPSFHSSDNACAASSFPVARVSNGAMFLTTYIPSSIVERKGICSTLSTSLSATLQ